MAMSVVQRSRNRSSVAASAYIAGEKLTDERTREVSDYSGKPGIELTGIALSEHAPEWAHDRAKLWNAAEKRETHPRAQTARSMILNLPHEFSAEQRREAAMKVAHMLADRYRGAVDYAVHEPGKDGDHRNYHCHFLQTARPFENGEWAKKKDRVLDDRYGKGPAEYKALRENIAGVINDIAVRERLEIWVEHWSFKERGLDLEPTTHLGPGAMARERRGEPTERGDHNRAVQARNEERQELRNQSNVINIEVARELQNRKRQVPLPPKWRVAYAQLYRDSYDRRAAVLERLQREHGEAERARRQESVRLEQSITGGNILSRAWRYMSGKTRQDKEQLEQVNAELASIRQRKEQAMAALEADRRARFEAFHRQRAEEQRQIRETLARAVGDEFRPPKASPAPGGSPAQAKTRVGSAAFPEAGPVRRDDPPARPDYEARRDAFFGRTRQRPAEVDRVEESPAPETGQSPAPPGPEIDAPKPRPDYEARRDAFFGRTRRRPRSAPSAENREEDSEPEPAP